MWLGILTWLLYLILIQYNLLGQRDLGLTCRCDCRLTGMAFPLKSSWTRVLICITPWQKQASVDDHIDKSMHAYYNSVHTEILMHVTSAQCHDHGLTVVNLWPSGRHLDVPDDQWLKRWKASLWSALKPLVQKHLIVELLEQCIILELINTLKPFRFWKDQARFKN